MKKLFLILFCLAFGMPTHPAGAVGGLRQLRSLNAVAADTNGAALGSISNGGSQWNVLITDNGANITATITIQVQMIDGTWVVGNPISPNPNTSATSTASFTVTANRLGPSQQSFTFEGPFQAMRVITVSQTVGTITADIFVGS
jgi:hypothetical protein